MRTATLATIAVLGLAACASPRSTEREAPAEQIGQERPSQEVDETHENTVAPAPLQEEGGQRAEQLVPPEPTAQPAPGLYQTGVIGPPGFDTVEIKTTVREDLGMHGSMQGTVDGQSFVLPLRGRAQPDGTFRVGGAHGTSSVEIEGSYVDGALEGVASGQILDKPAYQFRFSARPGR